MAHFKESLQRLQAVLEAQSIEHWWPVLSQLLERSIEWYQQHAATDMPDPAIDEILGIAEAGDFDSDADLAEALSELECMRRRASAGLGIEWTIFDGPFEQFKEVVAIELIRTDHDVRTKAQHIIWLLIGWATASAIEADTKTE
jgi:hypothetical protein